MIPPAACILSATCSGLSLYSNPGASPFHKMDNINVTGRTAFEHTFNSAQNGKKYLWRF
jgi:hypothetical protein